MVTGSEARLAQRALETTPQPRRDGAAGRAPRKRAARGLRAALALAPFLALSGCPVGYVIPPFDSSGTYEGSWEAVLEGSTDEIRCTCALDLEQDLILAFPEDHVIRGVITLNMTCPDASRELGRLGFPGIVHLEIEGVQLPDGRLYFAAGDCAELVCEGIVLSAVGADTDDDGRMDTVEGAWAFGAVFASDIVMLRGVLTAEAAGS